MTANHLENPVEAGLSQAIRRAPEGTRLRPLPHALGGYRHERMAR